MKRLGVLIWVVSVCVPMYISAWAAAVGMSDLPYLCGFEDVTENSEWNLNKGAVTSNLWIVGDREKYAGGNSLYISSDGVNPTYAAERNIVLAYRELQLAEGKYDFAFDYKGMGNGDDGYVRIFITNYSENQIKCLGNNIEPQYILDAVRPRNSTSPDLSLTGTADSIHSADSWTHVETSFSIIRSMENVNRTSRKLFLVIEWVNSSVAITKPSSIAIDNIQLAQHVDMGSPVFADFSYSSGTAYIDWTGTTAEKYDILYREKNEDVWYHAETVSSPLTLTGINFGAYEFWIRALVGDTMSVYKYMLPVFVYQVDCFDALNMRNVSFSSGAWSVKQSGGRWISTKTEQSTKRIDYGYESGRSRHTTHYMKSEYDPRTLNSYDINNRPVAPLKTVPQDAIGSVRIGNWTESGGNYVGMTFNYTVDSYASSILLIGYAMVLQDVAHFQEEMPRMQVSVRDEDGDLVDPDCGQVDFYIPTEAQRKSEDIYGSLWYMAKTGNNSSGIVSAWWQDWRYVGMDLKSYIGQTLTISIEAYGCGQTAHYGYGYYTIQCISSEMDGIPWGEGSSTSSFTAPTGFDYEWYRKEDFFETDGQSERQDSDPEKVQIGDNRPNLPYVFPPNRLTVSTSDTTDYICKMVFRNQNNTGCDYTMEVTGKPHTPEAEIGWEWVPRNCQNGVRVFNKSHVVLTNQLTGDTTRRYDMTLQTAQWDLPDGTKSQDLHYGDYWFFPCSDDGETLHFGLRASNWVNGEEWADSTEVDIVVPAIGTVHSFLRDTICQEQDGSQFYEFGGELHIGMPAGENEYIQTLKAWTGCDSLVHMRLYVAPVVDTIVYDTICAHGAYHFGGMTITQPGTQYVNTFSSRSTGCDSVVHLHLYKLPDFEVEAQQEIICADADWLRLRVRNSQYADAFVVRIPALSAEYAFSGRTPDAELLLPLSDFLPAHYDAVVSVQTPWCESQDIPVQFDVNFGKNIVKAKWDNVLAVLNENYNGGYRFRSFQWLRNGEPIVGETGSWLHAESLSNEADEYSLEVVLDDGTMLQVCPFRFMSVKPEEKTAARKRLIDGRLYIETNDETYDIFGQKTTLTHP